VFFVSDMWILQRLLEAGAEVDFTYLRGAETGAGRAVMPAADCGGSRCRSATTVS
jgi:hypothetical protein